MLSQNFKGLVTLVLIFSIVTGAFYAYKAVIEPEFATQQSLEQFPVSTETIEISPKIQVYSNRVIVSWDTPYETQGAVLLCKADSNECSEYKSLNNPSMRHEVTINDLLPNTQYEYQLSIDNEYYPSQNKFKFQTLADLQEQPQTPNTINTQNNNSYEEFKRAIEDQDLRFDKNGDGKVNLLDY